MNKQPELNKVGEAIFNLTVALFVTAVLSLVFFEEGLMNAGIHKLVFIIAYITGLPTIFGGLALFVVDKDKPRKPDDK